MYTMLLQVFVWPISDWLKVIFDFVMQTIDNGFQCCQSESKRLVHTKKSTIYEYVNLYSGPEYILNYRLSWLITVTYVTMLFGLGLPTLFPIALLNFSAIYAFERYHLAYTYQ